MKNAVAHRVNVAEFSVIKNNFLKIINVFEIKISQFEK